MTNPTQSTPLVSVIVAAFNAEKCIRRTLESTLAQDLGNFELVVIDGKSTDSTWQIVEEFADRIAYRISERDKGIADAYNKGIAAARGEWIYFLNSDDVFVSDTTLSEIFDGAPIKTATEVLAGRVLSDDGRLFDGRFDWKLLIRNQVHHQAIFYRSRFLRGHVYNDSYRTYGHDHEHNLMIWHSKVRVQYVPTTVALWARGGISDKANWKLYREEFRVRRNIMGAWAYPFNLFSVLRFAWKRARAAVALPRGV